jgi:hypothetical protein
VDREEKIEELVVMGFDDCDYSGHPWTSEVF